MPDLRLSLDNLEDEIWPEPGANATYLVRRCTELHRRPLEEFDTEDLRIMLGQQIGVPYLLPLALDVLEKEPLAEGDMFPGDLLAAVLRLDWSVQRRDLHERVTAIVRNLQPEDPYLADAIESFRRTAAGS